MVCILQWNLKGYWNNYQELQILLKELNPAIVSLQETHLPYTISPTPPKAYVGYFHNLSSNTSGKQGICVLIKKEIPHTKLNVISNISTIALEINIGFKVTMVSMYIPPDQTFSANEILSILNTISTPIILLGDLNSWSSLWGSPSDNQRGKVVEDVLFVSNLIVLNDGSPTHFSTHKTFTNIDITLCSAILAPKCSWRVLNNLHGSDHFPVITSIKSNFNKEPFKTRPRFITEKADWKKFQDCCLDLSFKYPISVNINKEAANIRKILRESSHLSIPQSKNCPRKQPLPWWNKNIAMLRKEKQNAWVVYKNKQTENNLVAYKKAKAAFRYHSKQAKRAAFDQLTTSINPNSTSRQIWQNIKRLTGTFKQSKLMAIQTEKGTLLASNEIAKYFSTTWSAYSSDLNFGQDFISGKNMVLNNIYNAPQPTSAAAKQIEECITSCEINEVLHSLKGKTPGYDRISYDIIRNSPLRIKNRLLNLFNNIFETGTYPQSWKNADIVPILKPNKPQDDINSYRPISLLTCLSKVLEKIMAKRIMWFALKEKRISHNQMAFKTGQGTSDALLHFEHYVKKAISSRNHVTVLGLDFEKAFDRIGVHVVLRQLSKWGIGTKIFNFIKGFLTNRTFRVKINNIFSDRVSLYNGIAQGSPISVLFFIIAFDEISNIIEKYNVEYSLYADDVLIYSKNNNLDVVRKNFTDILDDISDWALNSGACVSYQKCNILHICKKKTMQKS